MTCSHDIAIVDSHHLWDIGRHAYAWLRAEASSVVGDADNRRNCLLADFRDDTEPLQVVGPIHIDAGFDPVERVVFGSNFPVNRPFSGFDRLVQAFFECIKALGSVERNRLFSGDTIRFYRLDNTGKN